MKRILLSLILLLFLCLPAYAATWKLGFASDIHYDELNRPPGSSAALTYIGYFKTHMNTWGAQVAFHMGDDILSGDYMAAVKTKWEDSSPTLTATLYHVAPGNHDAEWITWAAYKTLYNCAWWESGTSYGSVDIDIDGGGNDIHMVSLDPNYTDNETHWSDSHGTTPENTPFGNIGATQLAWLTADLAANSLPVIVFIHQPIDTWHAGSDFTLKNAAAVRAVLEADAKTILVVGGHRHQDVLSSIKGIPYANIGSLSYPYYPVSSAVAYWDTVEIDSVTHAVTFKAWYYTTSVVEGMSQVFTPRLPPKTNGVVGSRKIGGVSYPVKSSGVSGTDRVETNTYTYIFTENFNAAAPDKTWTFTPQASGVIDDDYTTSPAPLEGAQSLSIYDTVAEYPSAVTSDWTAASDLYAYAKVNITYTTNIASYLLWYATATPADLAGISWNGANFRCFYSGGTSDNGSTTIPSGSTWNIWSEFHKSTGTNGIYSLWIASDDTTMPVWGAEECMVTNGTLTDAAASMHFDMVGQVAGQRLIVDKIRISKQRIWHKPN